MKSLEEDIADWANSRPGWQRQLLQRLCRNLPLDDATIDQLADVLIEDTATEAPALTPEDIPGRGLPGEPVVLRSLRDVASVNALAQGQVLTFAPIGLTVLYGDNASGKSGYARILRNAVSARVQGEVLSNVFATDEPFDQQAILEFSVGTDGVREWQWGDAKDQQLGRTHYHDGDCGLAYISTASEISYRPSALGLFDRLIAACDAIRAVLDARLRENAEQRKRLPQVATGTSAAAFLSSLSASASDEQLAAATTTDQHARTRLAAALEEEARLKASDPSKERNRLQRDSSHLDTIAEHCRVLEEILTAPALDVLEQKRSRAVQTRAAAKIASAESFDSEPVSGVGSQTWRTLWEAARNFSETEPYHGHTFPVTVSGSRCVLCQQLLDADATSRLQRFHQFMTDRTERDAAEADRVLRDARDEVVANQTLPSTVTFSLSQLRTGEDSPASQAQAWLESATHRVTEVVSWLDDVGERPQPVGPGPAEALAGKGRELARQAENIDSASFSAALKTASDEVAEIQGALALEQGANSIESEVERLRYRKKIELAREKTDTTGVTRKSSELTKDHVTRIVRDWFTREAENLKLRKITFDATAGRKGSLQHRPMLLGASDVSVMDVLSEGEKTALGLAGFITEVEFDEARSGVVLDDPVTSLDHERRSIVAKRLVELARERQVVIFTHDVVFVGDLVKLAQEQHVDVAERWCSRKGDYVGFWADKHPWKAKDVSSRVGELQADLERLSKERASLDQEEYETRVALWSGRLSETWERAVNLEIVNEVVDRGTSEVKPRMFRLFAAIGDADNEDFQAGYACTSQWAPRHDKAPEVNFVPPGPEEMQRELDRLKTWVRRIKKYKNPK